MYTKILVAIDGSEPSNLALAEAIKLAQALSSSICLFHVLDLRSLLTSEAAAASYDMLFEATRSDGVQVLHAAAAMVSRAAIKVETILDEAPGVPIGGSVVRKAHEYQAELIVCGTHGRRGVRRLLMGSDAEYIVRHSAVPVLLVRPPDAVREDTA